MPTFGDAQVFAIEAHLDASAHTDTTWHLGRMCVWAAAKSFGDLEERGCALGVTALCLERLKNRLHELVLPAAAGRTHDDVFSFLNDRLYVPSEGRSDADVTQDALHYSKYDFLTNGGESFDRTKSFVFCDQARVVLLLEHQDGAFQSVIVTSSEFSRVLDGFVTWTKTSSDAR